jgi:hypothetical protein
MNIHRNDFVCVSAADAFSHGCIEDVVILSGREHRIQLVLNSACTTNLPGSVNIEIIPQCLKYRRMITAVRSLPQSTEDVRSLFLTRELNSPVKQGRKRPYISSFTLDPSQQRALDKAIQSSFMIIEGQPGEYIAHELTRSSIVCAWLQTRMHCEHLAKMSDKNMPRKAPN